MNMLKLMFCLSFLFSYSCQTVNFWEFLWQWFNRLDVFHVTHLK